MVFGCSDVVGLFEWVVINFGLNNASATYQRAMNLIFFMTFFVLSLKYILMIL